MAKLRVAVLFGGRSGEHEVSLLSARSIINGLNPDKYEVIPIAITKTGKWVKGQVVLELFKQGELPDLKELEHETTADYRPILPSPETASKFDVVFPVLHGTYGEDGTVQGLLELANVAYVGAGVLGSAVSMDKGIMRDVLAQACLPLVPWQTITRFAWEQESQTVIKLIEESLGYPCFVKPANLGSSVGISKAKDRASLITALNVASEFDRRLVVEMAVERPREIECSVLGNDEPQASIPGEVIPGNEFYDYADKYINDRSKLLIPADLTEAQIATVQEYAITTFKAVDCSGMARVDFFVTKDDKIYVNEINTIPGFTRISMYPKLWDASGITFDDLLDRLINLALERLEDRDRRRTSI